MRGYNALQSSVKFFQNNEVKGEVESQKVGKRLTGKEFEQQEGSEAIKKRSGH